jgi:putative FmdB family regulatory protein
MAVLDFKCLNCGKKFYEVTMFSKKDQVRCPNCNSNNLQQIFSGTAFVKKGGDEPRSSGCSGHCGSCGRSCG